ncbi:MAG TPA: protein phosphatase CheZ [Noviherbaspirillum sp.]
MKQPVAADAPLSLADHLAHDEVLARVGQMTRMLHDNLRGLGFDKLLAKAAHDIPDARDRLDYVAKMTEQAAQRVLTATETASPLQEGIQTGAGGIAQEWRALMDAPFSEQQYRAMAERTLTYLAQAEEHATATKQHLLDIMMAQDFQDLTGQVIKKVTEIAHDIEQQLVQLLVDYAPPEMRREAGAGLMNGPQINPDGCADVVANQGQVDDLLESLGF